jgi:hypothetical protein
VARLPWPHGRVRQRAGDDLVEHELVGGLGEVHAVPAHPLGRVVARVAHHHPCPVHLRLPAAADVQVEVVPTATVPAAGQQRVVEACVPNNTMAHEHRTSQFS